MARDPSLYGPNAKPRVPGMRGFPSYVERRGKVKSAKDLRTQRISRRKAAAEAAAQFAISIGRRMDYHLSVTWGVLLNAHRDGDLTEGHVLGKPEKDRCAAFRKALGRELRRFDVPLCAVWARAVGAHEGAHFHIYLHITPAALPAVLATIGRLTGSRAQERAHDDPRDLVARSVAGRPGAFGWVLKKNTDGDRGSLGGAAYMAKQEEKHADAEQDLIGDQFGVSQAIGSKAQRRAGFTQENKT